MKLKDKLYIIDIEISKGLKARAADRLRNLINYYPDEIILWEKLAVLYYESGFYDAAGRYWILTEPDEEHIKHCVEIYEKTVNFSGNQILKDITFRGDRNKLSVYAKNKLEQLEINSRAKVGSVPAYTRKYFKQTNNVTTTERTFTQKLTEKLFLALLISIPVFLLIGIADGVFIVWNWLFGN